MKATLNFTNISPVAINMFSECQLAINTLAACEVAKKRATEAARAAGETDKRVIADKTAKERADVGAAKDRATTVCIMTISRFISTEDAVHGNIYHFNVEAFLKEIGVLSEGEVDKKLTDKMTKYRNSVIDRYSISATRRKNCDNFLTRGERKEIKNNPIDTVLAIIAGFIASGAIEYSEGGLTIKDFSKK